MAELVTGIAGDVFLKLSSAAFKEIGLWWGVKDEFEKLKNTVATIQAVLTDAEEQSAHNKQVKEWLGQLKEAFYDADDLLDDFSTESLRRKVMSGTKFSKEVSLFFSSPNRIAYAAKMSHKIRATNNELDQLLKNRGFHLNELPVDERSRDSRQTHSTLPKILIERENDKKEIKERLFSLDSDENVVIIPIVGFGGLGKTTLAQSLYNDEEVGKHFELKVWVCISDDFEVTLIVKKILESATHSKHEVTEMEYLKNKLLKHINGKKYLFVLDDVWNCDGKKWQDLEDVLVCGAAKGCRIIVTTRLEIVARITSPVRPHKLQGLPDHKAWWLFSQIAFGKKEPENVNLKAIREEIVTKCHGVPLAIKVLGGLWRTMKTKREWESFSKKELFKIKQEENAIESTLMLSYTHLSSHLKQCFVFCSLFPKDHKFDVEKLINLWMAQGFIVPADPNDSLVDTGYEYFNDLVWRSFFQECEENDLGNIVYCKMHDLIHDLAKLVAGSEIAMIDTSTSNVDKVRHALVDSGRKSELEIQSCLFNATKLRTLSLKHNYSSGPSVKKGQCEVIFSKWRCLRMLDLHDLSIEEVPPSISKLKHLRYLDLSKNKMKLLPNSITKLQNLQVLDLSECEKLIQLPKAIKKLINLTVLEISKCYSLTHMPRGIGQLTSLRSLPMFVMSNSKTKHSGGLGELKDLKNLRRALRIVGVRNTTNGDCKAANLKDKPCIESLELIGDCTSIENEEMKLEGLQPHHNLKRLKVDDYCGVKFPSWLSSLTNLKHLNLDECRKSRSLPPLDGLSSLEELILISLCELEYIDGNWDINKELSPLKSLTLRNCSNLKGWWNMGDPSTSSSSSSLTTELPQFHSLTHLTIEYCAKLTSLPPFPSLQYLDFWSMNENSMKQMLKLTLKCSDSTHFKIDDLEHNNSLLIASSLKDLQFSFCDDLVRLPGSIKYLTSLESLKIRNCSDLNLCIHDEDDNMLWQHLTSLKHLQINEIPKMESLPNGLQHLTTLQSLKICTCDNLKSLPTWMPNLTSLQSLWIANCGQLSARCTENSGEYWHLIAHIPIIIT